MKRGFSDYGSAERWEADAVVLGAGAGGCAAACALAEAGLSVLVVEAGSHWASADFKPDTAWAYRNLYEGHGTRVAVGNTVIPVPGGRGVGGSTLINSAISFRTPVPVLARWSEQYGCWRLNPAAMAPRLDRVCETLGVTVNPVSVQKTNNLIFKLGADRLGLPGHWMPRSAPGCIGCAMCYAGCPSGGKWTADRTFLAKAINTGRVVVCGDAAVRSVETRGDAVVAVRGETIDPATLRPAGSFEARGRIFVLSAGPVGSPRLLIDQGLANDSTCGHNLHLHPASGMLARFEQEIRPWQGVMQGFYVDHWDRGYLLQTYNTAPDQTYLSLPAALGPALLEVVRDLKHMAMAGPIIHDEDSVGRVTPEAMTYVLGEGDRGRLLAGLRATAEVFLAAGALEVYAGVVGGRPIRSEADIPLVLHDDLPARSLYVYASHPMGTCRMGTDPANSVVDPDGRVWGWKNLHVADASVFPTSLGVNPQVTTMAVALAIGEAAAGGVG